jgi:hypothetical protein
VENSGVLVERCGSNIKKYKAPPFLKISPKKITFQNKSLTIPTNYPSTLRRFNQTSKCLNPNLLQQIDLANRQKNYRQTATKKNIYVDFIFPSYFDGSTL